MEISTFTLRCNEISALHPITAGRCLFRDPRSRDTAGTGPAAGPAALSRIQTLADALREIHAQCLQALKLLAGFHAFGGDRHVRTARRRHDGTFLAFAIGTVTVVVGLPAAPIRAKTLFGEKMREAPPKVFLTVIQADGTFNAVDKL